jgi:uncharacterized protein (UPF0335 family)
MKIEELKDDVKAQGLLQAFIERIEEMEEKKADIMEDMRSIFDEIKAHGFDVKIIKKIIQIRKQSTEEREEFETLIAVYMEALGDTKVLV